MPKNVDLNERRRELVEAVWRVIRSDGLEGASVRSVAREAGLSTGSLRHYFASQSELLVFAMRTVTERIEARIADVDRSADPVAAAKTVLSQLLPLDEERRAENEVWLAFTARAMVDAELRPLRDEAYDNLRQGCRWWVDQLLPASEEDARDLEADRLFALIDGLAVHAAMRPRKATPAMLTAVLHHHLDALVSLAPDATSGPRFGA